MTDVWQARQRAATGMAAEEGRPAVCAVGCPHLRGNRRPAGFGIAYATRDFVRAGDAPFSAPFTRKAYISYNSPPQLNRSEATRR